MAELVVCGPEPFQRWRRPIPAREVIRLGRAPRSGWAVPWDALISREHVELQLVNSQLRIRRLEGTRNPVYVKDADSSDFLLNNGEQFRIGRTVFQLEIDVEYEERVRNSIDAIPALLLEQHVNFYGPSGEQVHRELRDPSSPLSLQMAAKFRCVIVLETAAGIGPDSRFDMDRFLRVVWERVAQAFELPYDAELFHPEQIAQALKSEAPAAFCILDVQNLSQSDLHRLRGLGFTQVSHHVLYVGDNPQLVSMSYPTSTPNAEDVSSIVEASWVPETRKLSKQLPADTRLACLQRILPHARSSGNVEDFLSQCITAVLMFVPDCQLAAIVLFEPGTRKPLMWRWDSRDDSIGRFIPPDDEQLSKIFAYRTILPTTIEEETRANVTVPIWDADERPLGYTVLVTNDSEFPADGEFKLSIADAIALGVENRQAKIARAWNEETRREMEIAQIVQKNLFPKSRPVLPGYEFADLLESADYIGGDFWDYVCLEPDRVVVVVGDVAGKGIPSALIVSLLLATCRSALRSRANLQEAMSDVNRALFSRSLGHRFATLIFAEVNAVTHTLTLVNAGHLVPLLRHSDGVVERIGLAEAGLPVGIVEDSVFEAISIPFAAGEKLLVFTDGVTEATNARKEIFGQERINALLCGHHEKSADLVTQVSNGIHAFLEEAPLRDDFCLVACTRLGDVGM